VRFILHYFAAISLAIGLSAGLTAQTPAAGPAAKPAASAAATPVARSKSPIEVTDPVADPRAVVTQGNARFTVLTPELIRLEWAMDGKFEDHASFVFLNRRLPVPKFEKTISTDGRDTLTIKTDALTLVYTAQPDGKPLPPFGYSLRGDNLSITLNVDGKPVVWNPGLTDPDNLLSTTRPLDGALGSKT
jgi:alpha-glucosidase